MRKLLFQSLIETPLTETAPVLKRRLSSPHGELVEPRGRLGWLAGRDSFSNHDL